MYTHKRNYYYDSTTIRLRGWVGAEGGEKKCVSSVRMCACVCARVCARRRRRPTRFFFRERECVCVRTVRRRNVRTAAGWERECERVRGGDVAPESLCERERVHVNMRAYTSAAAAAAHYYTRARCSPKESCIYSGAPCRRRYNHRTAHARRSHTPTHVTHTDSRPGVENTTDTRIRPPPRTSCDSLFPSFTTFVAVVKCILCHTRIYYV